MSKFTTEVRFICEQYAGRKDSAGFGDINEIISAAIPKVFSFDFPIFDEAYRNVLCTKILKHYYTREICEETVGLWKLRLDERLNLYMPYYNQLYKSALLEFNPFYDIDTTTTNKGKRVEDVNKKNNDIASNKGNVKSDTKNDGATTNNDVKRDMYSDTPQGSLQNVENQTYLTNARKNTDDRNETRHDSAVGNVDSKNEYSSEATETAKMNTTDDYITRVIGKSGGKSYSEMLKEFRETFLNIDEMVIDKLRLLFFGLWW